MYEVAVNQHFDAAHYLRNYGGRCENLHGHRFQVSVELQAHDLNDIGLLYDFTRLKAALKDVLSRFDHVCLNDVPPFDKINPSSENIARTIYEALRPSLANEPVTLKCVRVWESPDAWATYYPS